MFEKYSNSFLKDFNFDNILEKFERKTFYNFRKGEFIYRENEPVNNIYFILSGEVKLIKMNYCDDSGYTLRKSVAGDIIGLDDALMGRNYTNSSYASENSNVLAISKADFIEITKKNDEFNYWVLKYLSSRKIDAMPE